MTMFRRYALVLTALVCAANLAAQEFFNLTAQEVKIDSMLPRFTYSLPLGADFADSVYTVHIDYPEFIDMSATDVARYHAVTADTLPEMPVVDQYVGVSRKQGRLYAAFVPLVCRDGKMQKLVSFSLRVSAEPRSKVSAARKAPMEGATERYAEHSVLATGQWAKIRVPATGVYQLTQALVRQAGFSDVNKVKIYGYGGALQPEQIKGTYLVKTDDLKEVASCMVNGRRLFHAVGPVNWEANTSRDRTRNPYSDYGYYFLTESDGEPLMQDSAAFVSSFYPSPNDYHALYEVDNFAWFHGGRNLYESTLFEIGKAREITLPAHVPSGRLVVAMSFDAGFNATVSVNGTQVGTMSPSSSVVDAVGHIKDSYVSATSSVWSFDVGQILTENTTVSILQNSGGNMRLDYVGFTFAQPKPAPTLSVATHPVPEYVYRITNQDHHADPQADMVIIIPTTQKFVAQAERLKKLHEAKDSLRVNIVPADELYNEFSSGTPDANAYRRYMKMLYDRATSADDMPRFLLLFGDGAWDNRMLTSDWRTASPDDFLLCYESENSFSETKCYVSDDFFGMLDDGEGTRMVTSDCSDLGIGRLPARTAADAEALVDKIVSYYSNENAGAWQNTICFMGDDGNQNMHMEDAESVASLIQKNYPSFNIKRIYWDAYQRVSSSTGNTYPDVTRLIKQQMQTGALVMNYTGHGAAYTVSHEMVLRIADYAAPTSMRLPLWLTASCDIMPFDGQEETIGETAMLNKNGGAIAFFGTTRTVYAYYNRYMNQAYMKHVLGTVNGRRTTIGEAVMLAKNELVTAEKDGDRTENKLQYTLLGDPAITLAAPTLTAVIDSINGQAAADNVVALTAGSVVTMKGHIEGAPAFNGSVTATVYDVEETVVCQMNNKSETETAFTFKNRPNAIYNGSNRVDNGSFTLTFAVPKDIRYSDKTGLVMLYAVDDDKTLMAHGENESFTMTSGDEIQDDGVGPNIYCYLNSSSFMNGGTVNATPYFYAELSDKDGINVSGSSIGHDLELIIDGQMLRTYNLNEYFQYDFGDYRKGYVGYSLPELSEGTHKLLFRAWDMLNNSSTAELTFVVDPTQQPSLSNVICTDNPASSSTSFIISHNRQGSQVDVVLEILDPSGRVLWKKAESGLASDTNYTVDWDLTVGDGRRLRTGIYLYRVLVSSDGSKQATKAKKLIVIGNN